jgi:NADPH:quinone reductase
MRAIVIKQYGGPEVLEMCERPDPEAAAGQVLIEVKALGINHAEIYFRRGAWGDVAQISGIECVGLVRHDPRGQFRPGQKVMALVGGMGRTLNGSYAELTVVPASNVVSIDSELPWEVLAAIPESYASAWSCLAGNLQLKRGQTLLIRGATSAFGQAALNLAVYLGATVVATTRQLERGAGLKALGAQEVLLEVPSLATQVRELQPAGIDAVLDLIGNSTLLDSLAMLKRGGHACLAGFLGGGGALSSFEPVFQIPSGRYFSVFASALVLGNEEFPLAEIPWQRIVAGVADGSLQAGPVRVFEFAQMADAHRLVESGQANGKVVVRV